MVAFLVAVVPLMGSAVKVLRSPRALGVQTRVESVLVKACFPEPQRGQEATPSGQRRSRAHGKARSRPTGVDDGFLKCLACPWVRCTPLHSRRPVCDCPDQLAFHYNVLAWGKQGHFAKSLQKGTRIQLVVQAQSQPEDIASTPLLTATFVRPVHPVARGWGNQEEKFCANMPRVCYRLVVGTIKTG